MRKMGLLLLALLFSVNLFATVLSNSEWMAQLGTNFIEEAFVNATIEQYPDADEIILADTTIVTYSKDGTYVEENEYYLKANTHAGVKEARTQTFWYDSSYSSLEFNIVELIKPTGSIQFDVSKVCSEQIDNSQMSSNIYDPSSKIASALIPDMAAGDIVHIKITRKTTKARMPNFFADIFGLETSSPIFNLRYVISGPVALPLKSIVTRDAEALNVEFSETHENGRINYCWEAKDVHQVFPEPDMPAMYSCVGRCIVSTAKNWEEISKWYWELCEKPLNAITPEMEAEVQMLISGTATNSPERLMKVFTYVSQKIRYMGVTTEEVAPGYEPHPVSMTFENKHGVCRDKAALLVTMLRLAGFNSYPVLIMVGEKLDNEVPMTFFNHAIVAVQFDGTDEYVLMDPTNESTAELLPEYLCEKSYLVAKPEGEKLRVSPPIDYHKNMVSIKTTAQLEIAKDGANLLSDCHTTIDFKGLNDTMYRGFFVNNDKPTIQSFIRRNLMKANSKLILTDYKLLPADPSDTTKPLKLELFYDMVSPFPQSLNGSAAVIDVPKFSGVFGIVNMVMPDTSLLTRRFPLKILSTCGEEEHISIQLPNEFSEATFPKQLSNIDVSSGPFVFKYVAQLHPATGIVAPTLQLDLAIAITKLEVSPEEYEDCRSALFTQDLMSQIKPIFNTSAIKAAKDNSQTDTVQALSAFGMPSITNDGHVFEVLTVRVRVDSATSEVVVNRKQRVKLLDRAAKLEYSDVSFDYFPKYEKLKILSASTIKASGERNNSYITNLMDKAWVGSAPAYPACKQLVVNFPNTDVGDSVEYEVEMRTPVEYFTGKRFITALFASVENGAIEFDIPSIQEFLKNNPDKGYQLERIMNSQGAKKTEYSLGQTDFPAKTMFEQKPCLDDSMRANFFDFDYYVFRTQSALHGDEIARIIKAQDNPQGKYKACAKANELKQTLGDSASSLALLIAVRDYTAKHIRRIGPPFNKLSSQDYLAPDAVLEGGYANDFDYAVLQYTMLKELGLNPKLLLGISALRDKSPENFISSCVLTDVDLVLIEVEIDGKKYYPNIGSQYALDMSLTPKFCKVPLFDYNGKISKRTYSDSKESEFIACDEFNHIIIDVDQNGMATISVKNIRNKQLLEEFVKQYSELLPEMKGRHHAQLVGTHGRSAIAIGDLNIDVATNTVTRAYKVRMPLPTLNTDSKDKFLQYTLPEAFTTLPSPKPFLRNYPMQRDTELLQRNVVEVILPENYEILAEPNTFSLNLGDGEGSVVVCREKQLVDNQNKKHFIITNTLSLSKMEDSVSPEAYLKYADEILKLNGYSNTFILKKK